MLPTTHAGPSIRAVRSALLLTCLLLNAALTACLPSKTCVPAADERSEKCLLEGPDITNARIEIKDQPSLHSSRTVWIGKGEELVARWDSYTWKLTFNGAQCDFNNFTQGTEDCELCNLCDESPTFRQLCPTSNGFVGGGDTIDDPDYTDPRVFVYEGFVTPERQPDAQPTTILFPNYVSGCSAIGYAPIPFTPTVNAAYQVWTPELSTSSAVLADKDVFVIEDGLKQTITYELEQYVSDPGTSPPKVWYRWTVRGDPLWLDNFSNSLRAAKVRVLKGAPVTDPITGRFRLEDALPVRPSRILFLGDFVESEPRSKSDILNHPDENDQRCYADASNDGDVDITRCRQTIGNGTGVLYDATPTYTKNSPQLQLTWIVEFNAAEGADYDPTTPGFDPVPAGAVLAIEFTIEKVR